MCLKFFAFLHDRLALATLVFLLCRGAYATNGTNALAFSAEGFAVGGADIGFIRDTAAVAVNPANLGQIPAARFDTVLGTTLADGIRHSDRFGNSQTQTNSPIPFATLGYAHRLSPSTVVGVALVGQGGVGVKYNNLNTAFGTRDTLKNILRIAKLSAGFSRQVSERLSLGASLELLYSDLEQSFFPNTSVAGFSGYKLDRADTLSAGIRLGLRARVHRTLHVGLAYVTAMDLEFKNARYVSDMSAAGLGKVRYQADITRQKQPRELGIGFAYAPSGTFTLVGEVNWIDWSSAFDRPHLKATKPSNPLAPAVLETELIQEWNDQYVYSIGAVYEPNTRITMRAGFNYARNPIPDRNLLPLFPLIGEKHAMLGIGYKLPDGWQLDGTYVRSLPNSVRYTNNNAPFGPDAEEKFSLSHFMVSLTYLWDS